MATDISFLENANFRLVTPTYVFPYYCAPSTQDS